VRTATSASPYRTPQRKVAAADSVSIEAMMSPRVKTSRAMQRVGTAGCPLEISATPALPLALGSKHRCNGYAFALPHQYLRRFNSSHSWVQVFGWDNVE
jgi:hypothetical protein